MNVIPVSPPVAPGSAVIPAGDEERLRDDFHRLVQGGYQAPAPGRVQSWLDALNPAEVPDDVQTLLDAVNGCRCSKPVVQDPHHLAFNAPLGLLEGAWLQCVARAENAYRRVVVELFAAYLALLGHDEAASPAAAYRGALAGSGLSLPPVDAWQFSRDARIGVPALQFAGVQLELGLAATSRLSEVIGFSLGYLGSDSPWRLACVAPERRQALLAELARCVERALHIQLAAADSAQTETARHKVCQGYALYRRCESEYRAALDAFVATGMSLAHKVEVMLRGKVRFAKGYHGAAELEGRLLDDWFAEEPFDASGFLHAFATSNYVAGPRGQRLFDRLTGFGGPMFGIFSHEELTLVNDWLDSLEPGGRAAESGSIDRPLDGGRPDGGEAVSRGSASGLTLAIPAGAKPPKQDPPAAGKNGGTATLVPRRTQTLPPARDLFHHLVNIEDFPAAVDHARTLVTREVRRARNAVSTRGPIRERFFAYSPQALSERVARIHCEELARYRPLAGKPKLQRDEYVFGIRQFAPAILVDGAWLQHACSVAQQDDRLHRLLFHIYADELGAGRREWNHTHVYRQLLQDSGVELPEVSAAAFARDPGFLDAAFDLPVYLLGISLFPARWLPELLGLNLAIELSGLGAQYLFLADELDYWGLDPLIVRLHLSIDSLAGGHAAWATEAVQIHLERVRAVGGEAAVAEHWRRVWCGYLSLGTATRRFRWALGLAFCRRFLPGRIARRLRSVLGEL